MISAHPVKHSFSFSRDTPSYQLVFQMVDLTPVTLNLNRWETGGYTLVFKWSVDIQLNIRFQSVRTHGYIILVFKWFDHTRLHKLFRMIGTHPVKYSFSFSRDTPSYQLVFQIVDTQPVTHSISNGRETRSYTLFSRRSGHTGLDTHF